MSELTSTDLRSKVLESAEKVVELRSKPADQRGDTHALDLRAAVDSLHEADALFEAARKVEAYDAGLQALAQAAERSAAGPAAAFNETESRDAGAQFVESDAYRNLNGEARSSSPVEVRNLITGSSDGTSGSHSFVPQGSPYLSEGGIRRQRFFLRDVLPVIQTGLDNVPYIRELNAAANEGGASAVSEASAKPEVTMEFERADAPVRKLAAWIQVTEEAFADAPTLRGYINTRLSYMLMVREEQQVLKGTGTAPQIEGIYTVDGTQSQGAVTGDLPATIGTAIGKVENVDGYADGVAINTLTYWAGIVDRHATQFDGGSTNAGLPFSTAPATLWGLPAIRTRALDPNEALVGDFARGATLFERAATTIRSTDSHASLFISNTLVVLAEKRLALAIHRPDFFVETTLDVA